MLRVEGSGVGKGRGWKGCEMTQQLATVQDRLPRLHRDKGHGEL